MIKKMTVGGWIAARCASMYTVYINRTGERHAKIYVQQL